MFASAIGDAITKSHNPDLEGKSMKKQLQAAYLDWVNHYLSIDRYAEAYGLTRNQARDLIDLGRSVHESIVTDEKAATPA